MTRALCLLFLLLSANSCRSLPWSSATPDSTTIAVSVTGNLLRSTERISGRSANVIFGSAHSQTLLDDDFAGTTTPRKVRVELGGKTSAEASPIVTELEGLGDAVIGMDVWRGTAVTFDYRRAVISVKRGGIKAPEDFQVFSFGGTPSVPITVDGESYRAIVDVASPDSIILPAKANRSRRKVTVSIGNDRFATDALFADVSHARIGARLLSNYLVTIDYRRGEVWLWRAP